MSDSLNITNFKKNGFIIIPNVMTSEEVSKIRKTFYEEFKNKSDEKRSLQNSDLLGDDDLLSIMIRTHFNERIISALAPIFGDNLYYIPDTSVQCNMFGLGAGAGWHIDAGSESGNSYLYSPDYLFGKIGIFLQDNTFDYGGGIDLIPGSHLGFKFFGGRRLVTRIYHNLFNYFVKFKKKVTVPINSGDAVFFDSRLLHRSSPPNSIQLDDWEKNMQRVNFNKICAKKSKYVIYWNIGSKKDADNYIRNRWVRVIEKVINESHNTSDFSYTNSLRYFYPTDFPSSYVDAANNSDQIRIRTPSPRLIAMFENLFKS